MNSKNHKKSSTDRPAYLRPAQAAEFLGLSIHTLNAWRWHRRKGRPCGPRFIGPPRAPRYAVEELEAFARGEVEHSPPTVKSKKPRARKPVEAIDDSMELGKPDVEDDEVSPI